MKSQRAFVKSSFYELLEGHKNGNYYCLGDHFFRGQGSQERMSLLGLLLQQHLLSEDIQRAFCVIYGIYGMTCPIDKIALQIRSTEARKSFTHKVHCTLKVSVNAHNIAQVTLPTNK